MNTFTALIKGSQIIRNERREERKKLREQGPTPEMVWAKYVDLYYSMSASGMWIVNQIQLPSPHDGFNANNDHVWKKNGWWQNQWKNYVLDRPSVYNGEVPLPPPYRGPSNVGNPPIGTFNGFPKSVENWRNYYKSQEAI